MFIYKEGAWKTEEPRQGKPAGVLSFSVADDRGILTSRKIGCLSHMWETRGAATLCAVERQGNYYSRGVVVYRRGFFLQKDFRAFTPA